ncbi:MAG: RNA methyltransferase [Chitinispirillaceae bacterium]|nr:RNA methyltransferase [Chitinispirillaceae bacterium]
MIDAAAVNPSRYPGIPLRELSAGQMKRIASSTTPQGIIAVVRIPAGTYRTALPADPGDRIVLLEDVQDPGNVGTMLRIAAAFDFSGVLLSRRCADPFSPKAVQSSAGALLVPWIRRGEGYLDAVGVLKRKGYRLYCADTEGAAEVGFAAAKRLVVAFGNEGAGLSDRLLHHADCRFAIPMKRQSVQSLNVAAAGAIALFAAFRKSGW